MSPVRLAATIGALVALVVLVAACTSGGGSGQLLHYQRVWPDMTEQTTVFDDGRVQMQHGDVLERLTLTPADIDRLRAALARPIPTGSPGDSPQRTLTLANGTVIQAPRPDPGTVTQLLDNLTSTHKLDG